MHGMLNYFLRRLMLVPLTFLVITFMVYAIMRSAPGGPIEQLEQQMKGEQGEAGGGAAGALIDNSPGLSEEAKEELRRYYKIDKPIYIGYLSWLGVLPYDNQLSISNEERAKNPEFWQAVYDLGTAHSKIKQDLKDHLAQRNWEEKGDSFLVPLADYHRQQDPDFYMELDRLHSGGLPELDNLRKLAKTRNLEVVLTTIYASATELDFQQAGSFGQRAQELLKEKIQSLKVLKEKLEPRSIVVTGEMNYYQVKYEFSGILQLDFGHSTQRSNDALAVITSKFPVSIYFGMIGYLSTWLVCIPLGVFKAIKHRSLFDTVSSVTVFLGYAFPGFVACILLLVWFGGGGYFSWVPLGGFRSDGWNEWWENGEYFRCVVDQVHHSLVPLFGYMIASFASMTVLMKNSLMENLGADYVRTAFAKGLPENRVIFIHALRNSLIPITAGIGHALGIILAGSFLIEKTCNIDGMGLLGLESLLARDYPVVMGILVFTVLIRLFGNIFSDIIWAIVDPRIRFQ